jgi:hypothetical protein
VSVVCGWKIGQGHSSHRSLTPDTGIACGWSRPVSAVNAAVSEGRQPQTGEGENSS